MRWASTSCLYLCVLAVNGADIDKEARHFRPGTYPTETILGKAVDLRDALPYDDLGIAHRGAVNIIKEEYMDQCIYQMGGPQTKQEEVVSSSAQEFASAMAYDAGIDGAIGGFKLAASRSVRQASDLHKHRTFAKKTVSIQLRSLNVRVECLQNASYINPGFLNDILNLPSSHDLTELPDFTHSEWEKYHKFLEKWGSAVLTAGIEGGALEITMSEGSGNKGENGHIKNTLLATYTGLAGIHANVTQTLAESMVDRDGYLNLLIAGGSKEARSAVQHRFENLITQGKAYSSLNVTSLWSQSVESDHAVLTKGKYTTFDRLSWADVLGSFGSSHLDPGVLSKNLRMAISIHLSSAWSHGCPPYSWSVEKRRCELDKNEQVYNRRVKIVADNGNCVEYDPDSRRLVAKRPDCNMGFSIFTFHVSNASEDGKFAFALELDNRHRIVSSLKNDGTVSLLPTSAKTTNNFMLTSDYHLVYSDGYQEKRFAYLDEKHGLMHFSLKTPLRTQHMSHFYLEPFDGAVGNPLTSQEEFKQFMTQYYSEYGAPYFRISAPFWGEQMVVRPLSPFARVSIAKPIPKQKKVINVAWWPFPSYDDDDVEGWNDSDSEDEGNLEQEEQVSLVVENKRDVSQLWKFQTIRFRQGEMVVNVTTARNHHTMCLSPSKYLKSAPVSLNHCQNYRGWILEYSTAYRGSIRFRVPGTRYCLYRLDSPLFSRNSPERRRIDSGFQLLDCEQNQDYDPSLSMFKLRVILGSNK